MSVEPAPSARESALVTILLAPFRAVEQARGWRRVGLLAVYGMVVLAIGGFLWRRAQLAGLPDVAEPFDVAAHRALARVPDDRNAFVAYRRAAGRFRDMSRLEPRPDHPAGRPGPAARGPGPVGRLGPDLRVARLVAGRPGDVGPGRPLVDGPAQGVRRRRAVRPGGGPTASPAEALRRYLPEPGDSPDRDEAEPLPGKEPPDEPGGRPRVGAPGPALDLGPERGVVGQPALLALAARLDDRDLPERRARRPLAAGRAEYPEQHPPPDLILPRLGAGRAPAAVAGRDHHEDPMRPEPVDRVPRDDPFPALGVPATPGLADRPPRGLRPTVLTGGQGERGRQPVGPIQMSPGISDNSHPPISPAIDLDPPGLRESLPGPTSVLGPDRAGDLHLARAGDRVRLASSRLQPQEA